MNLADLYRTDLTKSSVAPLAGGAQAAPGPADQPPRAPNYVTANTGPAGINPVVDPTLSVPPGTPPEVAALIGPGSLGAAPPPDPVYDQPPLTAEERDLLRQGTMEALAKFRPMGTRLNADTVDYAPDGAMTPAVRERLAQGPHVYSSRAEKLAKDGMPHPVSSAPAPAVALAHPDMSKPGRHISGDSPAYRPGTGRLA